MRKGFASVLLASAALFACVSATPDMDHANASPEGKKVFQHKDALREQFGVELRAATVLDGINTNVLKVDMRSKDKTLDERVATAQKVARFLKEQGVVPASHHRIAFDFPVSFQVGCTPLSLYERVQLELKSFTTIQKLPAQRVLANDNLTRGQMGQTILDDTQWNIPFFVVVDAVEIAREVNGVAAKDDELFVSVHAVWTNVGQQVATMTDDPWRIVDGSEAKRGDQVAILDGGSTHLARNGGHIKMPPVNPGESRERWYVYRVPKERLQTGALAFARQRYAKANSQQKQWTLAGFELWVNIKNGFAPSLQPEPGRPMMVFNEDWRGAVDATTDERANGIRTRRL